MSEYVAYEYYRWIFVPEIVLDHNNHPHVKFEDIVTTLNEFGAQGWEVISIDRSAKIISKDVTTPAAEVYFKRPYIKMLGETNE